MSGYWQETRVRRIGRRAMLRGGIALAAGGVGASLIACGGNDSSDAGRATNSSTVPNSAGATVTPQKGGRVNVGAPSLQNFSSLATRSGVSQGAGIIISNHFQQALLNIDNDVKLSPALATKWETPDPVTYVFTLRDGVRFHDGTPVDSESVKWSLERNNKTNPKFPPGESALGNQAADTSLFTKRRMEAR